MSAPTLNFDRRSRKASNRFRRWFFEGIRKTSAGTVEHQSHWWNVMCLTGVDYFSTLGYQPGIAFLAAGLLSPMATLVLVLLTIFGALPVYRQVAWSSPNGQGSISMLERLLPGWRGKALVLALLGFAATDFIITITLSAADATAHMIENPIVLQLLPGVLHDRVLVTSFLLVLLGAIFLSGFREAIGLSVALVVSYLVLNAVTIAVSFQHLLSHPEVFVGWQEKLLQQHHHSYWQMIAVSLLLFPRLALGMSGFETGVAVMPLIKGNSAEPTDRPVTRIENAHKLLSSAALIMAVFLLSSSVVCTLLIPAPAFEAHGAANGRAISYLAHHYLGHGFGSAYDTSSILILWFAGASAMAGLLNLVPRYLPRYGMAPDWAGAIRPLVVFFTIIALAVTLIFNADVDAQAGAYATGVLVLMTSAALAVTINLWSGHKYSRWVYCLISLVFIYTSIANMLERPEGLRIAGFFIGTILITSLISRAARSLELRIKSVEFDAVAQSFIDESLRRGSDINLLAHRPGSHEYGKKEKETRELHKLSPEEAIFLFIEVHIADASEFYGDCLQVTGHEIDGHRVLRCQGHATANAIAAIALHIRDTTGIIPHAFFGWTEGHPLLYVFKYIFWGEGETAPVTREILREVEPNPAKRPKIYVA